MKPPLRPLVPSYLGVRRSREHHKICEHAIHRRPGAGAAGKDAQAEPLLAESYKILSIAYGVGDARHAQCFAVAGVAVSAHAPRAAWR